MRAHRITKEGPQSMDARLVVLLLAGMTSQAFGAGARSRNFIVEAPTPQLAEEIAQAAETYRLELAQEWLGRPLPDWHQPCPIVAHVQPKMPAGGRTSFMFQRRVPFGWEMEIQGSRERVLDSVLPHEVTHTIFATHFGRPLPRWADEGACTTVEHTTERKKQEDWLIQFLQTERGIPFNRMFAMTEYPGDILPLYSQGYSVARFLIAQGGKPKFVQFVGSGMDTGDWNGAIRHFYGFESLGQLQVTWVDWVKEGSNEMALADSSNIQLVSNTSVQEGSNSPRSDLAVDTPSRSENDTLENPLASGTRGYRTVRGTRPLIDHASASQADNWSRDEAPVTRTAAAAADARTRPTGSWYAR